MGEGGGELEERNGKWRLSGCRVHEPPARLRRPRPRLGPQHAAAGSAKSHANATCRLPSDRAVDAKALAPHARALSPGPLSAAVGPASLLAPPTSAYTRTTLSNLKQRKTDLWCHVTLQVSPSPVLPS